MQLLIFVAILKAQQITEFPACTVSIYLVKRRINVDADTDRIPASLSTATAKSLGRSTESLAALQSFFSSCDFRLSVCRVQRR